MVTETQLSIYNPELKRKILIHEINVFGVKSRILTYFYLKKNFGSFVLLLADGRTLVFHPEPM